MVSLDKRALTSTLKAGLAAMVVATVIAGTAFAQGAGALGKAQAFFNQGNLRAAQIELRNALRANPNDAQARLLQARIFLRVGQGIGAQTEIEAARRAGVDRNQTRTLMAEALVLQRRSQDALRELETGVPTSLAGEAARVTALAQLSMADPKKALESAQRAVQLQPRDSQTYIDLARIWVANRDVNRALGAIDQALALEPRNVRGLLVKGDLVRSTQGLGKALPFFDQALQLDPQSIEARLERTATLVDLRREAEATQELERLSKQIPDHPLVLYLDAVMKTRQQKFTEAQALMQRTKGTLDQYPPAMLLQGMIAYETNNLEQAQTFLSRVMQAAPQNPLARRLLGATQLRRNDADGAIATLMPLVQANQADSRLLALIGAAYARKNDYTNATKFFEQAVQREPNQPALRAQLAMGRVALGQNVQATQDLQNILRLDPKSLQALTMITLIDLRSRNFKTALTSAQRLVQTYPELPLAYNMLAAAQLGMGNAKDAEANFRRALEKKPDYHEARRNLAQLYRTQNKFAEARRELQLVLESDRNNVRTMLALADIAAGQNRSDEQVQWLRRAVTAEPRNIVPRVQLTNAFLRMNDRAKALEEATTLDRDFPNNPAALELLGLAQISNQQFDRAIGTYNRLIGQQPQSIAAHVLLARAYAAAKQPADARRIYQRALALQGQDRPGLLVDVMNFEASQNNFDTALGYANELRRISPNTAVADATIGNLFMGARRWADAARAYEAARKVRFERPVAINLSRAYENLGQTDQSAAVLRAWLQRNPTDAAVRLQVANVLLTGGRYPQAIAEYEGIVKANGGSPAVLNNLAWAYNKVNDRRALATAQQANRLAPDAPEIQDTLGWILVSRNIDPRQGLQLLQRAAQRLRNNPDVQYHLAFALRANGRPREAIQLLDQTLARHKEFDQIAEARALLSQLRAQGR
jgi:putative PEP-CTERM system TPR-repeat lipoprotein